MKIGGSFGLIARGAWCSAFIVALLVPLAVGANYPHHLEHHISETQLLWAMVLSFPIGAVYYVLLTLVLIGIHAVFGIYVGNGPFFMVVVQWFPAFLLGYWQWFVALPRYLNDRQMRRSTRAR